MGLSAILRHLLLTVHSPNAIHSDAAHSLEALDRIITNLMEANLQSNAAPPASNETILVTVGQDDREKPMDQRI